MFSILVMDDDAHLRRLFTKSLSKNHRVYSAATIKEAAALLDQHRFDIFVCDMLMGDQLGVDLLRQYYSTLHNHGTCVVVLSADEHYFDQCRELGIETLLSKPIMPHSLVHIVEQMLRTSSEPS